MKKSILLIIIGIISLSTFSLVNAQTAEQACSSKKNGDACTYTRSGGRGSTTINEKGYCDRTNGDTDASKNPLICKSTTSTDNWENCTVEGDACFGNTGGGRGGTNELGTCTKITSSGGPRSSGTTTIACDTSKKPPGNPGGRASDGSSGGGTCQDCGGSKCNTGQVCATVGGAKKCVQDKGSAGKCGASPCSTGQVCIEIGGASKCEANQCPGGVGAGNGGGGTTPPANTTPTDASSPQTVGFINPSRFNSITELIAGIINALLGILGAITVAVLVSSGFKYMTSSNPGEVGQALEGIRNAIVGLMIIMGAFLITQYVITALAG